MNAQELHTIRGFVQALPRQPGREEAVRVAIITEDGTEYHVLHKGAGTGLLSNINADVEITGTVSPLAVPPASAAPLTVDDAPPGMDDEAQAPRLVAVKSYRLTDGFDGPWYDDAVR